MLVEQISTEIRTISHLLHPPLLDEVGLASALRWYIDGFRDRSTINVEIDVSPDLGRLSAEKETAIFRIVQECLTNIHRHSGQDRRDPHIEEWRANSCCGRRLWWRHHLGQTPHDSQRSKRYRFSRYGGTNKVPWRQSGDTIHKRRQHRDCDFSAVSCR